MRKTKQSKANEPVAAPVKLSPADYWNVQALMGRATAAQRQAQDASVAAQQSIVALTERLVKLGAMPADKQIVSFNGNDEACEVAVQVQ